MKKTYFSLCLWLGFLTLSAQNTVIYVNASASGANSGLSWADAYTDLAHALRQAQPGDALWVAAGLYKPTGGTARDSSFRLKSGVALYGGFAGTETALTQRDWEKNLSVLSGDLGTPGDSSDNAYTVVYMDNPDSSTVLDGFLVREGCANYGGGDVSATHPRRSGGGLYIMAAGGEAYAEVRNCRFERNRARNSGGAVYVNGTNEGSVAPRFWRCVFRGNIARDGGALRRDGGSEVERPLDFAWCAFEDNVSQNYGGGLYYNESEQQDSLQVYGCQFVNNFAKGLGGGLFLALGREKGSNITVRKCLFERNNAQTGGEAVNFTTFNLLSIKNITFDSCLFTSNGLAPKLTRIIDGDGYGLNTSLSRFVVSNSQFRQNKGSGINCELISGQGLLYSCLFRENDNTFISYNLSEFNGVTISKSIFHSTSSDRYSSIRLAGTSVAGTSASMDNVFFQSHQPNSVALYLEPASLIMTNSTFAVGSLIKFPNQPSVNLIERKIIIQNSVLSVQKLVHSTIFDEAKKEHKVFINNSYMPANFCGDLPDYPTVTCDSGNYVGVPPLFVAANAGDYRLQPCSPLVNAGSNAHVSATNTHDLGGQPRIQGGRVDIGAYETAAPLLTGTPVVLGACAGQANGSVNVSTSGGCEPLQYQWAASNGEMGVGKTGLPSGAYTFTVSDQRGSSFSFSVSMPDTLSILNAVVSQASGSSQADGSISVTVAGGTLPYHALWSNGKAGLELLGIPPGTYTLTLTDANTCTLTTTYVVGTSSVEDPMLPQAQVFPNPATDALSVRLPALLPGHPLRFALSDALGRTVHEVALTDFETAVDVAGLPAGMYFWRLSVRGEVVQAGKVVKIQ